MLLSADDWQHMAAREVAPRDGKPIVALDLGGGRAWSGAVAVWKTGRIEALAVAPGIPSLADQEKRDLVPRGTYSRLAENGRLRVAEGLRVTPPGRALQRRDGRMGRTGAGRVRPLPPWRIAGLRERHGGTAPRVSVERSGVRHSGRASARQGRAVVRRGTVAAVACRIPGRRHGEKRRSGNTRLVKSGTHNTAWDDVAAALTLAAGVYQRARAQPKRAGAYLGTA